MGAGLLGERGAEFSVGGGEDELVSGSDLLVEDGVELDFVASDQGEQTAGSGEFDDIG